MLLHTTTISSLNRSAMRRDQSGTILVIALILMLIITVVGVFSVGSTQLEVQMASNAQFKNIIFQESENAIEESSSDMNILGDAYGASLTTATPVWPSNPITAPTSSNNFLSSNSIVEFVGFSSPKGNAFGSARLGASGYSFYNYEIKGTATLVNAGATNTNVRGVYVKGARPN